MALASTENQLFTKQRTNIATSQWTGILSPVIKAFFMTMAQFANMKQLITYVISDLTDDVVVADAACTLYALFLRKQNTATDAYFKLFDDATNSGTAGDERITLPLLAAKDECAVIYPKGTAMAAGIVITSHTTSNGTTDTTTGDGPDGVIIYGAA